MIKGVTRGGVPLHAHGQITVPVPVPTLALSQITGLTRQELVGSVFEITANTAAATDTDVGPHGWRLLPRREHHLAVAQSWSDTIA
ncbi:hypothetical protein PV350_44485 [Streptomyces sp. PA03-6a]|nr:hypothetical protein [Streptomyces sp. PA03-6a]